MIKVKNIIDRVGSSKREKYNILTFNTHVGIFHIQIIFYCI